MTPEEMTPWLERLATVGLQDGSTYEVILIPTPSDGEYLMQPPGVSTYEALAHIQAEDIVYIATVGEFLEEPEEALPE